MAERILTEYLVSYRVPAQPALGEVSFAYASQASTLTAALGELESERGALPPGAIIVRAEITGRDAVVKER